MPVVVTHAKVSAVADGGDASLVQPSDWNANHTITGLATVAETGAYTDLSGRPTLATVAQATVDFGASETESTTVTVSATWVTTSSIIVCSAAGASTADHDAEDAAVEGVMATATNIVDGASFDIIASAPRGTWGRYIINAVGL